MAEQQKTSSAAALATLLIGLTLWVAAAAVMVLTAQSGRVWAAWAVAFLVIPFAAWMVRAITEVRVQRRGHGWVTEATKRPAVNVMSSRETIDRADRIKRDVEKGNK